MAEAPLTRDILRKEIKKKFPGVAIKKNETYKEAAFLTLEEQLGVKRANLTGVKAYHFDKELIGFYMNFTSWWGKSPIFWNEDRLRKKHRVWLEHVICLGSDLEELPVTNHLWLLS